MRGARVPSGVARRIRTLRVGREAPLHSPVVAERYQPVTAPPNTLDGLQTSHLLIKR